MFTQNAGITAEFYQRPAPFQLFTNLFVKKGVLVMHPLHQVCLTPQHNAVICKVPTETQEEESSKDKQNCVCVYNFVLGRIHIQPWAHISQVCVFAGCRVDTSTRASKRNSSSL